MNVLFTTVLRIAVPLSILLSGCGSNDTSAKKESAVNNFPPLVWKTGDWWIVQTRFVANQARLLDAPEKLGFFSYYHLFQVVGTDSVAGMECGVVEVRPFNVPAEERNDHGTGYLWRLYCNVNDMSLRRLIVNTRMGPYLISGDLTSDTIDYGEGSPVVVAGTPLLVPLDIPKMPFQEMPLTMPEEQRDLHFFDGHSLQEYHQYAGIVVSPEKDTVLTIKFWDAAKEIRSQVWKPGLPWWSRWRLDTTGPYETGMRDASLVQRGGAQEQPRF